MGSRRSAREFALQMLYQTETSKIPMSKIEQHF